MGPPCGLWKLRAARGQLLGQTLLIKAGVPGRAQSVPLSSVLGMALRGACLLLCLVSLAHISVQQNGKGRQKPAASKKGKGQA